MHKALLIESKDGGIMDKMKVGIVALAAICAGAARDSSRSPGTDSRENNP